MAHQIEPDVIHATLVRVAGDGQALEAAARTARAAGDAVRDAFGTAGEAQSAFAAFWVDRAGTGERISALLFHRATCVAEAAEAFIDSDGVMTADARAAMSALR